MNIEFHYFMTKYIALNAGFDEDEAEILAYSSQFVDDNFTRFQIERDEEETYENYISQTRDITQPIKKLMRVYLLFHFFPGDPISPKVRRRDGKMHLLMTTPGNNLAQDVFYSVNKDDNLYALGIASHMLSDTFSHQNFVGLFEEINSLKGVWESLIPNIGHADALYKPDIPNLIWHDPRLIKENAEVDNRERVLLAAKKLYNNFLFITSMPSKWNSVKQNISALLSSSINESELDLYPEQKEERIAKLIKLIEKFDCEADYDPNRWMNDAVEQKVHFLNDRKFTFDPIKDTFQAKKSFSKSHWFRFQETIKEYQKIATQKIKPLLNQLEIREW